jgi:phosphopantothenoylcysteine decarboxylase/phosphopantothenate--cysteine ligase
MSLDPFVRTELTSIFRGKEILLGITGGIAAYKCPELIRLLTDVEARVQVVMTENAERFVAPLTLSTLSGRAVATSLWQSQTTGHIDQARAADLFVIAPATANTMAKIAQGLADDLLTTEALAFLGPKVLAPAMNPAMWAAAPTQRNHTILKNDGWQIIAPTTGMMACGETGQGRMAEPHQILMALAEILVQESSPKGHNPRPHVVITAGPTQSDLDPVRYLTNRSSGIMAAALSWQALKRGFQPVVICGPCPARDRSYFAPGSQITDITTADEMQTAALTAWGHPLAKYFIGAAAVLDWSVAPSSDKLKKSQLANSTILQLPVSETTDIVATAASRARPNQRVFAFAAETTNTEDHALTKLKEKNVHGIFANTVGKADQGFGEKQNGGIYYSAKDSSKKVVAPTDKSTLAAWLFDQYIDFDRDDELGQTKAIKDMTDGHTELSH